MAGQGSPNLLGTAADPAPTSALLSSTTRRSWTCLTVPATLTHATANPTSKSTRMPLAASTPQGSPLASSARRMRWVSDGAGVEKGWQLGACQTRSALGKGKGRSSWGWDRARRGWSAARLQQDAALTPQDTEVSFFLPCVVVADPVPKAGSSVPHHCQHPDERAELSFPCHLHHSPVPDESVPPPRAGEMSSCFVAPLFLIPRQHTGVSWKGGSS